MRVPHGCTILVADGAKRLLARNDGDADHVSLTVVDAAEQAAPPTHEIATDAAGRAPAGAGGGGGAAIESADPHDQEEERFAIETAELLRRGVADGRFAKLIVIAAPRTLGVLRKHYDRSVADHLLGELAKDVTGAPIAAIEKLLAAH